MTDPNADATLFLGLGRLPGVGSKTVMGLAVAFPTAEALLAADPEMLEGAVGSAMAQRFLAVRSRLQETLGQARRVIERHTDRGIAIVPFTADAYPPLLRLTTDPPPILYMRGREDVLASSQTVAIVGTREPTPTGVAIAAKVAERFAREGYVVVSDLAAGIDTTAHRGALAGGVTAAVLGTPIDDRPVSWTDHRTP